MPALTNRDHQRLAERGISAHNGTFGTEITFTTSGIAWLFNYLQSSDNTGAMLTLSLLRDLAKFQPSVSSLRSLRFQAIPIPVYDTNYFQLVFYLEGSPPRAFHAFHPGIKAVSNIFHVPLMKSGVFKIRNDQIVKIKFSALEAEQLAEGKPLRTVPTNS